MNNTRWTKEEISYLKKNYIKKGPRVCAENLKRSYLGIAMKANQLRLKIDFSGKKYNVKGYVMVKDYKHPNRNKQMNIISEHVKIVAKRIGRALKKGEIVHHIDMTRTNNNLSNLFLCSSRAEHQITHHSLNKLVKSLLDQKMIKFKGGKYVMAKQKDECKSCYSYGLWYLGDPSPMGQIEASDGMGTIACPECKANANPIKRRVKK